MSNRSPSNRPVPVACRSRAWGDQLWGTRHRTLTGGRDRVWAANRVIARSPSFLPHHSMRPRRPSGDTDGTAKSRILFIPPPFPAVTAAVLSCPHSDKSRADGVSGRSAFAVQDSAFAGAKEFRKRTEERGQLMVPCQISSGISMRQLREYCRSRKATQCTESSHGQRRWCPSRPWRSQCTGIIPH
jgi:hypothetical protein